MIVNGSVLLKEVAKGSGISQEEVKIIWSNLLEGVIQHLKNGEAVVLPKIGKLYTKHLGERNAVNPKTGEKIIAKSKNIVKFFPYPFLKKAVNKD